MARSTRNATGRPVATNGVKVRSTEGRTPTIKPPRGDRTRPPWWPVSPWLPPGWTIEVAPAGRNRSCQKVFSGWSRRPMGSVAPCPGGSLHRRRQRGRDPTGRRQGPRPSELAGRAGRASRRHRPGPRIARTAAPRRGPEEAWPSVSWVGHDAFDGVGQHHREGELGSVRRRSGSVSSTSRVCPRASMTKAYSPCPTMAPAGR